MSPVSDASGPLSPGSVTSSATGGLVDGIVKAESDAGRSVDETAEQKPQPKPVPSKPKWWADLVKPDGPTGRPPATGRPSALVDSPMKTVAGLLRSFQPLSKENAKPEAVQPRGLVNNGNMWATTDASLVGC